MPQKTSNKSKQEEDPKNFKETDILPNEKYGMRHLIECNCIHPVYKNRQPTVWHKFPVFSIIEKNNEVTPKFAQCNNCGIIHKVTEIGVSEITIKENLKSIRTIEEIKMGLQQDVAGLLEQYELDVSVWEEAEFIISNQKWGSIIVLDKETEDGVTTGKALIFQGTPVLAKIEPFIRQEVVK